MELLKADFSEEELKRLERRFAAAPTRGGGANAGGATVAHRRGWRSETSGEEAGVRFVELLHWGTPRRRPSGDGNEEVCLCRREPRR